MSSSIPEHSASGRVGGSDRWRGSLPEPLASSATDHPVSQVGGWTAGWRLREKASEKVVKEVKVVKVVKVVIVVPDVLCFSMESLVLYQTSLALLGKTNDFSDFIIKQLLLE